MQYLFLIQERDRLLRENGDLRQEMARLRVRRRPSARHRVRPARHVCSDARFGHVGS